MVENGDRGVSKVTGRNMMGNEGRKTRGARSLSSVGQKEWVCAFREERGVNDLNRRNLHGK